MENGVQDTGHPPPSPLTGCYLLIVVGEPHTKEHKDIILQRIAKGLLSWDITDCLIDIEKELAIITEQALEGEEARYGERLIQYASENLVTEILIHPAVSTLAQCIRNLLSSFTRHRHIIHAGYTYAANGSWILQDGTFSSVDFSEAFQEVEVQRVIRAYENSISLDIHCSPEGDWSRLPKEPCAKYCKVRLNPVDVLNPGSPSLTNFLNYISPYLVPAELETILECSDVVGNIRFSHPTLYIFPGGQGDAALFGINGFNMLLDGGFSRKACFWDFVRHLDRLDAVLMTRLNNGNVNGLSAVVKRKMQSALYPQIGHFFCNFQERKSLLSPDGDKDKDPLLINLLDEGQNMMANLKKLNLTPQSCYRDSEPINLYHKVGHGTLDMYVLSPAKDSKEVREFLYKWNNNDAKLFTSSQKTKDFQFPLQNLISICCLLVWQPANPNDNITRILYPGSTPQHKVFEGLDRLKNLEYIKHPVCSENKLTSSIIGMKSKVKDNSLEKIIADQKKKPTKPVEKKIENKDVEISTNGVENGDKTVKKSDSTDSEKSLKDKKKPIKKEEKPKPKPKVEVKPEKKKVIQDKKPSPTTPKKTITEPKLNGDAPKPKPKLSPSATPAKSAKEATNRKVIESKKQASKKEPPKQPEKPKEKTERKPISRRPKPPSPAGKATGSPIKKVNGVQKPDSIIKKAKLDKEGTTDSSTVSTPSADQKDITKLTPEEIEQLKAQELADLKEEQEVVKEIEAVFRKGEGGKDNDTELRKIKDVSIEDKTEPEEYLIIEKEEVEQVVEDKTKEDETQKLTRDSEESEKVRKLSDEIKLPIKSTEEAQNQEGKKSEGISATSLEERLDISSEKKLQEGDQNVALESQPDEKFSTTVESGATTAPTLPEDERITLDEIKEDEHVEEKHVKEDTKEKEVPIIQLPPQSAESSPKIPPIAGIKLEKQTPMRDIVKTPDEVADLPMHEEADFGQYPMDVMKTSLKAEDMKLDAKKDEKAEDKPQEKEEKSDEPKEILDEDKDTKKEELQKDEEPKLTKEEVPKEDLQTKPAEQQPSPAEDISKATEIIKISELPASIDPKVPIEDILPTPPQDELKIEEKQSEKIEDAQKDVTEERKMSIAKETVNIAADQREEIKEDGRKLSIASVEEASKEANLLDNEVELKTKEETKSPSLIIGEKVEERTSSIAHEDEISKVDQKPSSPTQELDRKASVGSQQDAGSPTPTKDTKLEDRKPSIAEAEERKSPSPSKDSERKLSVSSIARSPSPTKNEKIEERKQSVTKDEERETPSPTKDAERKLSVSSITKSPTPTEDEKIQERKQSIAKDAARQTTSPSKDAERKSSVSSIARSPTPTKDEVNQERKQSIVKDAERKTPSPTKDAERKLSVSSIPKSPTPPKEEIIEETKESIAKDEERKTPSPSKDAERKPSVSSIARSPTPTKDEKIQERKQSIAKDADRKTPSPSKDAERKLSLSSVAKSPTPPKEEIIEETKQSIAKDEERKTPSPSKDAERKSSVSSIARSPTPTKDEKIQERKQSIAKDADMKTPSPSKDAERKLSVSSVAKSPTPPKEEIIEETKQSIAKDDERKTPSPSKDAGRKSSVSSVARSPTPTKDEKIQERKQSIAKDADRKTPSPSKDAERKLSVSSVAKSPTPPKEEIIEETKQSIAKDEERKTPSPSKDAERKSSVSSVARSPTPTKDEQIQERKQSIAKDAGRKTPSPSKDAERKLSVSSVARSPTPTVDEKFQERKQSIAKDADRKTPSPTKDAERKLSVSSIAKSPTPPKEETTEERKQSIVGKDLEEQRTSSPAKDMEEKLDLKVEEKHEVKKDDKQQKSEEKPQEKETKIEEVARKVDLAPEADTKSPTPTKDDKIEESEPTPIAKDIETKLAEDLKPEEKKDDQPEKIEDKDKEEENKSAEEMVDTLNDLQADIKDLTPKSDSQIPVKDDSKEERKASIAGKDLEEQRIEELKVDDKLDVTKDDTTGKIETKAQEHDKKIEEDSVDEKLDMPEKEEEIIEERKQSIAGLETKLPEGLKLDGNTEEKVDDKQHKMDKEENKIEEKADDMSKEKLDGADLKDTSSKQETTSSIPPKEEIEEQRIPSPIKDQGTKLAAVPAKLDGEFEEKKDDKQEKIQEKETSAERKPSIISNELEEQRIPSPSKDIGTNLTEDLKPGKPEEIHDEKPTIEDKPQEEEKKSEKHEIIDEPKEQFDDLKDATPSKSPTPSKEETPKERKQSIVGLEDHLDGKPEEKKDDKQTEDNKTINEIDIKDVSSKSGTPSPTPPKEEIIEDRKSSIIPKDLEDTALQADTKSPTPPKEESEARKLSISTKDVQEDRRSPPPIEEPGRKLSVASKEEARSPTPTNDDEINERRPSIASKDGDTKLDVGGESPIARSPTPSEDTHIKEDKKSPVPLKEGKSETSITKEDTRSPTPTKDEKLSKEIEDTPSSPRTKEATRSPTPTKEAKLDERKPSIQEEQIVPALIKEDEKPLVEREETKGEEKVAEKDEVKTEVMEVTPVVHKDTEDNRTKEESKDIKEDVKETGDITKKGAEEAQELKPKALEEALPKVEVEDAGMKLSEDKEEKVQQQADTSKEVKPSASMQETKDEKGDAEKEVKDIPTGKDGAKRPSDVGLEDTKLADKDSPLQNGSISDYSMEDNKQLEDNKHLEEITKARLTKEDQKTTLHIDQESRSASLTESPEMSSETLQTFRETEIIDKMEVGRKSPKEREEDVAIIVASVAEVLKSDAPLEEFEGKLPVAVAPFSEFTTYTTELRETHITTLDSPVTDDSKMPIDSNIIQETIPEQDEERRGSKASDLIKESKEFMETTSKIISDIKQAKPEEKLDDGEPGTVHRMLVTASSEDGGEETEICPKGSITFSKSSESSGRSTPDLCGQKVKDSSGKSTPDIKITDFEKADLEDNEKVFRDDDDDTKDNDLGKIDKPEPPKSGTSTPDLEKSTASKEKSPSPDSGLTETTKEAKSGSVSSLKEATKPVVGVLPEPERKDPFDSGRSTPEFKDDKLVDTLEQPHAKTASDSGRSTPDTKSLDELKQVSGKSTPELKVDDKKKDVETLKDPKDTIEVKEDDKSGKSTPKSIISGKSSPDLKVDDDLSKSSTPDLKAEIGQAGLSLKDEIKAVDTIAKEETLVSKLEDIPQKMLPTKDEDEIPPSYDSCQRDRIEHKGEEKIEKTEEPMKDSEDNFVQQESKGPQPELEVTQKLGGETVEEEAKRPIPEVDRSKTPSPLPRTESSVESKSSPAPVPSKIEDKSPTPIPSKTIEAVEKTPKSEPPSEEEIGKITSKQEEEEAKTEAKSSVIVVEGAMQGIKTDQKTERASSDIKETVKDFLAAETSTPYLSTAGPSKDEASSLSGKSTPDIAEVERFKDIQETLKYEKHIPGHSTPPTVPVSPIVKDVTIPDVKPITSIKEQEIRSSTPGSDSDFSSSQISRATNILEGEARESDDEDILGSPTSVTSQIGHSPQYDFEDEKKGQKHDPMSVSFYGSLPGDKADKFVDDADLDFEKAMLEHRQARGEDLTSEGAAYLQDFTRKVDAKAKEGSLMTSSFIGTELPTHHEDHHEEKEDPIASWGKPLGLPSPAPPDNKGTPKKEKKLPANVSAKNKLNDDRKRSESPSKYDKKKKYNPIYVDLTYVPHHGNANYSYVDFFKRVRARYYVFSGIEPSKEVYNGLLEAKQTWEDKDLEVTIIPTYDTDVLGYWVAENDELLTKFKIDLSPSASRCTINLQDHETSCSAYRLEF